MAHKKWIPKIYILIRWLSPSILTPIKQLEAKLGLGIAKLNRSQKNKNNIMQYSEKGCEDKRAETRWLNSMGPSWTRSSVCLILLERSRTMIFNPAHVESISRCLVKLGLAWLDLAGLHTYGTNYTSRLQNTGKQIIYRTGLLTSSWW